MFSECLFALINRSLILITIDPLHVTVSSCDLDSGKNEPLLNAFDLHSNVFLHGRSNQCRSQFAKNGLGKLKGKPKAFVTTQTSIT